MQSKPMLLALALALAGPLEAQQPPTGSIRGIVYDSLIAHGGLGNAVVELLELGRVTRTDARGVFRFDSLPGGSFTLAFSDSSFSSIGFAPPERTVSLGEGIDVAVTLATPSPNTIYRALCPGPREPDTGVLLGTLREAGSGHPLVGADVRGDWMVTNLSKETGFSRRPLVVRSAVDSLGRYQLCGVPIDVPVLLRAAAGDREGPPLDLRLAGQLFAVRHLSLDLAPAGAPGRATIAGRITAGGAGLAGAQVLVLGTNRIARTDDNGRFVLDSLGAGTRTIEARAIGYDRRRTGAELMPDQTTTVNLTLPKLAVELPELNVTEVAGESGFESRRRRATGGYFITADDIYRRASVRVEDLFRTVPGMRVEQVGINDYRILSARGGSGFGNVCEPSVFVDDIRIPLDPEAGLSLPLAPEEVQGIEVYQGPATAPLQYRARGENCGVILIWTRRTRK